MQKAMQLAQDVVGQMAAGFGLAVDVQGHIRIFAAHFLYEGAQVQDGWVQIGAGREFVIVQAQNEGTGAALLLRKLA